MTKREQAYVEITILGHFIREKVDGRLGSGKIELTALANTGIGRKELERLTKLDRNWFDAYLILDAKRTGLRTTYKGETCTADEAQVYFETGVPPSVQRQGKGVIVKVIGDGELPQNVSGKRPDIIMSPTWFGQRRPFFGTPEEQAAKFIDKHGNAIVSKTRVDLLEGILANGGKIIGAPNDSPLILSCWAGPAFYMGRPNKDRLTKAAKRFNKQAGKFKITR